MDSWAFRQGAFLSLLVKLRVLSDIEMAPWPAVDSSALVVSRAARGFSGYGVTPEARGLFSFALQ
jgi:hypothetical protein